MSYWPGASLAHMCADTWVHWLGVDFLPVVSSLFHVCVYLPVDCGVDSLVELRLNNIFLLDVWNPLPAALCSSTESSAQKQNKDGHGVHSHAQHFYQSQWKFPNFEREHDSWLHMYIIVKISVEKFNILGPFSQCVFHLPRTMTWCVTMIWIVVGCVTLVILFFRHLEGWTVKIIFKFDNRYNSCLVERR